MNTTTPVTSSLIVIPQVLILPPHLITAQNTSLTRDKDTASIASRIASAVTTESLAIAVVLVIVAD
jgi:hypothetical protein